MNKLNKLVDTHNLLLKKDDTAGETEVCFGL